MAITSGVPTSAPPPYSRNDLEAQPLNGGNSNSNNTESARTISHTSLSRAFLPAGFASWAASVLKANFTRRVVCNTATTVVGGVGTYLAGSGVHDVLQQSLSDDSSELSLTAVGKLSAGLVLFSSAFGVALGNCAARTEFESVRAEFIPLDTQ
jgi:hypothetical protein